MLNKYIIEKKNNKKKNKYKLILIIKFYNKNYDA